MYEVYPALSRDHRHHHVGYRVPASSFGATSPTVISGSEVWLASLPVSPCFLYLSGYIWVAIEVRQTDVYAQWFRRLRDRRARARINARIRRLSLGNVGDVRPVGEGVSELRIDYGPGYRVYFVQQGQSLVLLLAGGDKSTQERDITRARNLARGLR